jgi:hypothetical protein
MGWPNQDSILATLIDNKLWTKDGDFQLSNLLKQIDNLKIELYKSFYSPHKQKSTRSRLNSAKQSYNKYYAIRHCMDHATIEGFCDNLKNQYLLYHSLYLQNNNTKISDIYLIDDYDLDPIAREINSYSIDISQFRKLARCDIWKSYWSANKESLFDKSTINLTDEQRTLLVFSRMYDSARESPDSPPEPVFDDDDMFDGWLLLQHEKYKDDKKSRQTELGLGDKMSKAQEMFIVAKNLDDAKEVHSLNSENSKSIIRERSNAIKKSSGLDVTELPDVKRDIQKQSQEMFKQKFRKK